MLVKHGAGEVGADRGLEDGEGAHPVSRARLDGGLAWAEAELLALAGLPHDRLGGRPAAAGRDVVVLVEVGVVAAEVVAEAAAGGVEVEVATGLVGRVAEGVDHLGRDEREAARAEHQVLLVERDAEPALEAVEGVGVMAVDVPLRPSWFGA